MIFTGILISTLLGYTILRNALKKTSLLETELTLALSVSLGLAASGLLTFLSLLLIGEFNRTFIILLNLAALLVFAISGPRQAFTSKARNVSPEKYALNFLGIFACISLFIIISELSLSQPYGQWDAWALWNMKTKFIILGGKSWQNIFQLHWHTQPDYPLFLPMINAWLHAASNAELPQIAMTTASLFTLMTGVLLFAALKPSLPYLCALGAGLLLVTNRFYLFMGTAQYADIVLAHYLLAVFALIVLGFRKNDPALFFITGLFLGILCFIKNEGATMALILLTLLLFSYKRTSPKYVLAGFAATAWAPLLFKIFLAPPNRDISLNALAMLPQLLSADRIGLILEYFFRTVLDPYWHYIWMFIFLLIVLSIRAFRHTEMKILAVFLATYLTAVGIVYLTTMNFDLAWRLSRTIQRVLFCVMPAVLFLSVSAVWRQQDNPLDVKANNGIMPRP